MSAIIDIMKEQLRDLGFSEKEANTYPVIASMMPATVMESRGGEGNKNAFAFRPAFAS